MTEQFYFSKVLRWADKGGLMRMGVIQIKHGDSDLPPVNTISNQINTMETNLREEIYLDGAISKTLWL